jgi:hypothetical protein
MSSGKPAGASRRSAAPVPTSHTGNDDPRLVDVKKVEQRLLPRGLEMMPRSWTPWRLPSHSVPIDKEIERLIHSHRRPRLIERENFRRSGILCPYWYARSATIVAIGIANKEASFSKADLQKQVNSISRLIKTVQAVRRDVAKLHDAWAVADIDRGLDRWPQVKPQEVGQVRSNLGDQDRVMSSSLPYSLVLTPFSMSSVVLF